MSGKNQYRNDGRTSAPGGTSRPSNTATPIPVILTDQYGVRWKDRLIIYVTKEITTPKFRRYRTKFKKVFCGNLEEYGAYLRKFMKKRAGKMLIGA